MKILYVFPHPDDETFGPGPAIHAQARRGHEVHLLTLTRGEATKVRHKLGYDKAKMGAVRTLEMEKMARVLKLTGMRILDLPDSGLGDLEDDVIAAAVRKGIELVKPDVVVTYPEHGVSGFPDHLVTHRIVRDVFEELQSSGSPHPKRLAYFTLCPSFNTQLQEHKFPLKGDPLEEMGCVMETDAEDRTAFLRALDCYGTYQEVVKASGVKEIVTEKISFLFHQERFSPPLQCISLQLPH